MYYVYSVLEEEVLGPYSLIDLTVFIVPGILVCSSNQDVWKKAEDFPEIRELLIELGLIYPDLPEGIKVNSSGEIISTQSNRTTRVDDRAIQSNNTKDYSKITPWVILVVIVIMIIMFSN